MSGGGGGSGGGGDRKHGSGTRGAFTGRLRV